MDKIYLVKDFYIFNEVKHLILINNKIFKE